ncbi:MAG: flippase-like domain-containing protein [Planctomycetaceae bacterium]|nr:flippase-like domain-containing protein [Planctomycetaceae bacterium]
MKKRLILLAKILIVLAVAVWVGWELYKSWDKASQLNWKPDILWLTLSGIFYIIGYAPAAVFWRYAMVSLGQKPNWYETFRAYYIGHLGKYIPGKAMVVIMRSGMLDPARTRMSVAAAAVFLETLTMMASGAFLAAVILVVWFRSIPYGNYLTILALGAMLVSGLPVFPPVFRILAKKLGVGKNDPDIDEKLAGLKWTTLLTGWLLMLPAWTFLGLGLWATVRGIGIDPGTLSETLPRFTLAATLSIVLGFVAMIPAGAGVREFAAAQILVAFFAELLIRNDPGMPVQDAQQLAALQAILVAAVQRGVSILAELFVSLLFANRRSPFRWQHQIQQPPV